MSATSCLYKKSMEGEQITGENMFGFPRTGVHQHRDDAGKQGKVLEEKGIEVCVFTVPLAEASVSPVV
jgi:hypothetical protein